MADGSIGDSYLGIGMYSIPHAARLARVPARTVRRWLLGYHYKYKSRLQSSRPVIHHLDLSGNDDPLLSFRDLIEVMFVHSFRKHGLSWATIRHASEHARELVEDDHPFSTLRFRTDGQTVFADMAQKSGRKSLLDLIRRQYALRSVLLPSLVAQLDFTGTGKRSPLRWWPAGRSHSVVVDPARRFGEPIVNREGIPTRVLALAAAKGEKPKAIARWYETSTKSVRDSIEFEESFVA
jgi:uncharacterized protein (DUF433 family)